MSAAIDRKWHTSSADDAPELATFFPGRMAKKTRMIKPTGRSESRHSR